MMNPKIRFKKSDGSDYRDWNKKSLSKLTKEYVKKTTGNNQYTVLSSTHDGIKIQSEYFNKNASSMDTTGYKIVPKGYFTYRAMSDNDVFVFNRQMIIDNGIVSPAYPVFSTVNCSAEFFEQLINNTDDIKRQLKMTKEGGTRYALSYTKFCSMDLTLPSDIEEQIKIANFLSEIDNLITSAEREVESTKQLKKAMLQKMFPKKGEKVPEIRFPGFTDDWEQRKLEDVVEFLDTMRKPLEGAKRTPGPYPYYGASGIVDYVDGYLFDEELVLLSEDGANITDRNYPVCFLASGKYWVNNHAHVLRTKDGNENNFICNSLERKDYKQYNSGMAMPKLNQEVCRSIPISCPSFGEQKKIGDYFRNLDNLITLHQRKCDTYKKFKKSMMQKMFL